MRTITLTDSLNDDDIELRIEARTAMVILQRIVANMTSKGLTEDVSVIVRGNVTE